MDKDQYTAKSKKKDLPPRCPLIGFCDRWAQTIFFYQYYDSKSYMNKSIDYIQRLSKDGIIQDDFDDNKIEVIGEQPEFLRDNDRVSYRNMCPEINLFDDQFALNFAKNTASISGEYDKYREYHNKPGFNNYSERHYSECLEFSQYIFQNLDKKKISKYFIERKKRRTPISTKLRFEIFTRDKHKCQYCGRTITDGIKLEIDHKIPISEGGTDDYENLITACNECNNGKSNKIL
ncbi:MAG: HNH endonuclease [Bacteroidales bacterium]|nr:HNH endonuclease [Bacteroidales bacterium]HQP04893.1 HNH endonuclease [Bacteroidales bacterium]